LAETKHSGRAWIRFHVAPEIPRFDRGMLDLGHGYLNGAALAQLGLGAVGLLGIVAPSSRSSRSPRPSFVVPLRAVWARVVARVAGSWIAAIGLLLFGWAVRSGA